MPEHVRSLRSCSDHLSINRCLNPLSSSANPAITPLKNAPNIRLLMAIVYSNNSTRWVLSDRSFSPRSTLTLSNRKLRIVSELRRSKTQHNFFSRNTCIHQCFGNPFFCPIPLNPDHSLHNINMN